MSDDIIVIEGVGKCFGELEALKDVDLRIARGEVVVIVGPSGSGKSTLLRCINHLEVPTSGHISVDGIRMTDKKRDINLIRAEVGIVFQQFNLFPHLTVLRNVTLAQEKVRKRSKAEAKEVARQQLERVGIPEKADNATARGHRPGAGNESQDHAL
jgi:polar amino acid transport system ATP-binding protein